jgi:hypothetical protein
MNGKRVIRVGAVRYLSGVFGKTDKDIVRAFDRPDLLAISDSDGSLHGRSPITSGSSVNSRSRDICISNRESPPRLGEAP